MDEKELEKIIKEKKDYGSIIRVEEISSGGMDGGYKKNILYIEKKQLVKESQMWQYSPLEVNKYNVDEDKLKAFLDYINKYNFPEWSKIKEDDEFQALDAPTTSITLYYKKDDIDNYYTINYNIDISGKYNEIFREFINKFDNLIED